MRELRFLESTEVKALRVVEGVKVLLRALDIRTRPHLSEVQLAQWECKFLTVERKVFLALGEGWVY
jgi:hypothetical protein